MDVLCTRIVCHQLFRDDYRDLVATGRAVDQGIPYYGILWDDSIGIYIVKGTT